MSTSGSVGGQARGADGRTRLSVLMSGLSLGWSVWWYSQGGSQALVLFVGLCVGLALLLPRGLPTSARSLVWSLGFLLVAGLAVNLERLMPPEDGIDFLRVYLYDRVVTALLAMALTALFYRPSRVTATVVAVGGLPMLMLALVRDATVGATARQALILWGGLTLPMLAAVAQRSTAPRAGVPVAGGRAMAWRLAVMVVALLAAFLLTEPLTSLGRIGREQLLGMYNPRSQSRGGSADVLSLASPAAGFEGRVRRLLEIRAPEMPGYLREAVYRVYARGVWLRRAAVRPLEMLEGLPGGEAADLGVLSYRVLSGSGDADGRWWVYVPLPSPLSGFCLPGDALAVSPLDASVPTGDGDGIVMTEDGQPPQSFVVHRASAGGDAVYPLPRFDEAEADPGDYLLLPANVDDVVTNWVAACEGLREAESSSAAMAAVVGHFHKHYRYRLGVAPEGGDPLIGFMERREGHCTLFASAAAMMLRSEGIPTRVVGGYVGHERHPLTGRWMVRERDAHAWCEAWDVDAGRWRLVEATPPAGQPGAYLGPGWWRLLAEAAATLLRAFSEWLATVNPLALVAGMAGWLLGWGGRMLLSTPGLSLLVSLILVLCGWRLYRRRRAAGVGDEGTRLRAELVRVMGRKERRLVPAALRRYPAESWSAWERRVASALDPERRARLEGLLADYQELRYRPVPDVVRMRAWLAMVRRAP